MNETPRWSLSSHRRSRRRGSWNLPWAAALLAWLIFGPPAVVAQEAARPSEEEIIERILELQREIETLMRQLSPSALEELQRRLSGLPASAPKAGSTEAIPAEGSQVSPPPLEVSPAASEPPAVEAGTGCDSLRPFDSNGDGVVSAADRYWRYLYLGIDGDGDGRIEAPELKSAFERGVRGISMRLDTFARVKGADGLIRLRDQVVFDLGGDGFGDSDDAVLAVDATSLSRGTGPQVLDASGEPVSGVQPFEPGWKLRDSSGRVTQLRCPAD